MNSSESQDDALRRSTHVPHEVVYAAVGASAAADLMRFPPKGSTPYEDGVRLGSGSDRFLIASSTLMTWGALRGAGIEVADVQSGEGIEYSGVAFDEHGTPQPVADGDVEYGPDGEPYLTAGTSVTLTWADGRQPKRMRVVYTINEARRVGYAWGAADPHGVVGEEAFAVEHRDDDTVWATVRGFVWATENGLLGMKGKSAIREAKKDAHALIAALAPGVVNEPPAEASRDSTTDDPLRGADADDADAKD